MLIEHVSPYSYSESLKSFQIGYWLDGFTEYFSDMEAIESFYSNAIIEEVDIPNYSPENDDDIIFKALPSAKLSINISDIQELELSNGAKIFDNGILVSTDLGTFEKYNLPWDKSNELFSIKNKAISDANLKPMGHWLMYTTLVPVSFFGQLLVLKKNI